MYSFLLALIYIAFISLGLPDSLLGAGWPVMHEELGASLSSMGIITMIISGCTIISSLFSDFLTKKLGTRIVTVVSVFLTSIALLCFSFASEFWMLAVFAIPYGLGAGAIDAALNNYVAVHYKSKHMSWLHCFWGVGAIVSPFVMSYALTNSSWNDGYRIIGFVQLGIALVLLVTLPVWKKNASDTVQAEQRHYGVKDVLKTKGVPFLLIGFFAYCAAEATTMSWASTFFVEAKGIEPERAAQFASLFYIGMTVGRFAAGFVTDKLGDRKMIVIGACVIVVGVVLLFIPVGGALPIAAFIIIGLGCAPIYPSIIHCVPSVFGEDKSGAIIGVQMAGAYVGSTFMPPLFGVIGNAIGFAIMPAFLAVFFILMIVMTEVMFRSAAKAKRASV